MTHKLLFWLPGRNTPGRVLITALLVTVGFTSQSFAQSGSGPDLQASEVEVNSRFPSTGSGFRIGVTIENIGDAEAATTDVRFYRSDDATITTGDDELTDDPVSTGGPIESGESVRSAATVSITALGVHYLGACVETVTNETDTTNNCSPGLLVTVIDPDVDGPDLVLRTISVPDTVVAGASFIIDTSVVNLGNRPSTESTLRYFYLPPSWMEDCEELDDEDDYFDCLDDGPDDPDYFELGTTVSVGGLAVDASSTHRATVSIPGLEAGIYLIRACVDILDTEPPGDTGVLNRNNCSIVTRITVTEAPPPPPAPQPDLTISNVSASVSRVGISVPFMLNATVQNAGTLAAAATTLRYYRSNDATITTDDTQLATAAVAALAPDASSSQSAEVSIPDSRSRPPATMTWWVGACVDAVNDEDVTNNCSSAVRVEVVTQPDLIVRDLRVSDASVTPGTPFTVTATVENIGHRGSNFSSLHIYRSDDNTVTEADIELAVVRNVLSLPPSYAANNSETYTATVSISVAGAFQIIACVIPTPSVGESDDMSNNCSNPVPVTVALPPPTPPPPPPPTPDLIVENVSVTEATLEHGASLTISSTVRNRGSKASPATTLLYYISDDATITADDPGYSPRIGVGALAPGASSPQSHEVRILYPEGTWWLGACVGAVNEESATANNCSSGVQITVTSPAAPDLTVVNVSVSEASVEADVSFIINTTVQNTGRAASAATTLRYYRSDDDTVDTTDSELTTTAVAELAPDASSPQSAEVMIADVGSYWVGACVDPVSNETDNANNCSVGVPVTVIVPPDDTDTDTNAAALPAILRLLFGP